MCNYSMWLTALAHIAVRLSRTAHNHIWQSVKSVLRTLLAPFCVNHLGAGQSHAGLIHYNEPEEKYGKAVFSR